MTSQILMVRDGEVLAVKDSAADLLTLRELIDGPFIVRIADAETTLFFCGNDDAYALARTKPKWAWLHQLVAGLHETVRTPWHKISVMSWPMYVAVFRVQQYFPGSIVQSVA